MSCVGVWASANRRLVAVAVDGEGRAGPALRVASADEATWALLAYLEATHRGGAFALVLSDHLARNAPIGRAALETGVGLWLAPKPLVEGLRAVGRLTPARTAAALARLPAHTVFRAQLLRVAPGEQRQLSLW